MFFSDWHNILRIFIMAIVTYLSFILLLRLSGKRSLAKLTIFDVMITAAIGPIFASTITSKDLSLLDGLTAMGTLLLLQFLFSKLSVKFKGFDRTVKSEPKMLVYEGQLLFEAMEQERVNEKDIEAILRQKGITKREDVKALIMETDGSFSLIKSTS